MNHPQPPMLSVYDGQTCIGHILSRGRTGFEAFNQNSISLGIFSSEQQAADAVGAAAKEAAS